jgi:hypothetical protein
MWVSVCTCVGIYVCMSVCILLFRYVCVCKNVCVSACMYDVCVGMHVCV